jgi:hypothetical protein
MIYIFAYLTIEPKQLKNLLNLNVRLFYAGLAIFVNHKSTKSTNFTEISTIEQRQITDKTPF